MIGIDDLFKITVNAAPIAMLVVDKEGCIALANHKAEELFEYSIEELHQMNVDELVPDSVRVSHPKMRELYHKEPSTREMGKGRDLFCVTKSGKKVPIEIGLTPVTTDGKIFVISSILNITERKEAEEKLKNSAEKLSRINQNLEEFNYAVSHDLRAPLRRIASFAELLREELQPTGNEKTLRWINFIHESTKRMWALLDDLIEYSRSSYGELHLESVNMNQILKDVETDLSVQIQEEKTKISSTPLPSVQCDPVKIRQVLQNLIQNAIKFKSPDRPSLVQVSYSETPLEWTFCVEDNGKGIPKDFHEKLFKPFHRLSRDEKKPGYGMGLAICKRIIEKHGGKTWIDSDGNQGSKFYFSITKKIPPVENHETL